MYILCLVYYILVYYTQSIIHIKSAQEMGAAVLLEVIEELDSLAEDPY